MSEGQVAGGVRKMVGGVPGWVGGVGGGGGGTCLCPSLQRHERRPFFFSFFFLRVAHETNNN